MQRERLRDRDIMHSVCYALQPRALVGGSALIDYRGCGLMGAGLIYPWIRHWKTPTAL